MKKLWTAYAKLFGRAFLAAFFTLTASSGCVVSTDPGPVVNVPPLIYDAEVTCDFDPFFLDYYWDFLSFVDDADFDVIDVYVDVYDASTGIYLETFDLVFDGGDLYSNRVYETFSLYLDCLFAEEFEFDFVAVDIFGAFDRVTVLPFF